MQIQISGLMPGDVLIIKYNDTYWHTMLVVNNNRLAHAPSPGEPCVMEALASFASETKAEHTWSDSQLLERLYAYRYTGIMPYPGWVAFAEQWSVSDAGGRITRYGASPNEEQKKDSQWHNYPRYRGVLKGDDSQNAAALPFGVDALSRTIKWARKYRYNEAFSINRGTTCCAFVMACMQASFVNAAITPGNDGKTYLDNMVKIFDTTVRGPRQHTQGEAHAGGALRDQSNRGLSPAAQNQATQKQYTTDSALVTGLWNGFKKKGYVIDDWSAVGMPTALNHDAKYVYSRTLNHLLANDNSWAAK